MDYKEKGNKESRIDIDLKRRQKKAEKKRSKNQEWRRRRGGGVDTWVGKWAKINNLEIKRQRFKGGGKRNGTIEPFIKMKNTKL